MIIQAAPWVLFILFIVIALFLDLALLHNYGLSTILVFLGIKMSFSGYFHIRVLFSLGFIACTLVVCIIV